MMIPKSIVAGLCSLVLLGAQCIPALATTPETTGNSLQFNPAQYQTGTVTSGNTAVSYRAYEKIVYVKNPVDTKYQCMNIYIPAAYFEGRSVGSYTASTAPIFFPNSVGGYMPSEPGAITKAAMGPPPGAAAPPAGQGTPAALAGAPASSSSEGSSLNAIQTALVKGYVVAAPGARGRTTQDVSGTYTGKAPAAIVDLKAAVRYLRYNDGQMPGNAERIISNGTSAGGGLSALLGSSGNSADYEPYLKALGAADTSDSVFAVSAYCPITNLDNADAAYEWQFNGVNSYKKIQMSGMTDWHVQRTEISGALTPEEQNISNQLKALFPSYVNSLHLKDSAGVSLTLDANGDGTFKVGIQEKIMESAQTALNAGTDLSSMNFLTIANGKVTGVDFPKYVAYMNRMKLPGAFDALDLSAGENSLFGTATVDTQHFTAFGASHSTVSATTAKPETVRLMNPMSYIGEQGIATSKYWRIRHGAVDKDTGFAISYILATKLANTGAQVNFELPWGQGHGGDYDLPQLFQWTESVCQATDTAGIQLDGKGATYRTLTKDGTLYINLRDLAAALAKTPKAFDIAWSEPQHSILLTPGKAYTGAVSPTTPAKAQPVSFQGTVLINGAPLKVNALSADGNTYFPLDAVESAFKLKGVQVNGGINLITQ